MKYQLPDLKKILENEWAHNIGYGFKGNKEVKLEILEQGTTPQDPNILKKLGIKKGERVLSIASYYASWAKEIQNKEVDVIYSDVSKQILNYVRKNIEVKFKKYIHSNYELIPKKANEYDWTFTYEACGGGKGLTLAYLRSLLNKKGGILVICLDVKDKKGIQSKIKRYPDIVKTLSKIYKTKYSVKIIDIIAKKRGEDTKTRKFQISTIYTNEAARKKVKQDLISLNYVNKNKKISLEKGASNLKMTQKEFKESIFRLSRLETIENEYKKEMII